MKLAALLAGPLVVLAIPIVANKPSPIFPAAATDADPIYRDWYGPTLERLGEKPLWVDSDTSSNRETIRLTFISGASLIKGWSSTVIRIDIRDRNARLIARREFIDHGRRTVREVANRSVSSFQVGTLQKLVEQADTWKYPIGTWEEKDDISVHCTELIMERRRQSDYAVSHVSISCNQPSRLIPFVDYVARLAGQNGKLRY